MCITAKTAKKGTYKVRQHFVEQLKILNSDTQLVQYIQLDYGTDFDPVAQTFSNNCGYSIKISVHPDYAEVRDLQPVGTFNNLPVFKNKKEN